MIFGVIVLRLGSGMGEESTLEFRRRRRGGLHPQPKTQSYFLATLEGLGGRADEHPAVPCKLSVNFCPLSVPICHYQTMMRTRWTMPVWERPGKGTPAAQWKQGQYRPSPGRFPGIYSN